MLDNKETLLTEYNLHQQQHLQYQQEDFETILTIEASSIAHGPIRDECGNNIFWHKVYGIINAGDDITFTSDSSDISAHQLELLTPTIGETSATALKADLETLKAIHAEYKAKRNSLRRALRYNPYRSLFYLEGELFKDMGNCFDGLSVTLRAYLRIFPWSMLYVVLQNLSILLLFGLYVGLPLIFVPALLDFVFFFRFVICYPWHMRFIRSLQVDSIDEDWLGKMQALAEKITQDDVNYPDIVCVFQSSLLHVAGAGYDRNNHSFIIKKRVLSP